MLPFLYLSYGIADTCLVGGFLLILQTFFFLLILLMIMFYFLSSSHWSRSDEPEMRSHTCLLRILTATVTRPLGFVNFKLFEMKFKKICKYRRRSPWISWIMSRSF